VIPCRQFELVLWPDRHTYAFFHARSEALQPDLELYAADWDAEIVPSGTEVPGGWEALPDFVERESLRRSIDGEAAPPAERIAALRKSNPIGFWVGIAEFLVLLMLAGGFINFILVTMHEAQARALRSAIASDLRSMQSALEAYRSDHGAYPIGRPLESFGVDPSQVRSLGGGGLMGIEPGSHDVAGITTPVSYADRVYEDRFHPARDVPAFYFQAGEMWLLGGICFDGRYNIPADFSLEGEREEIEARLIPLTYDPTNGARSAGDVWRLKD